MNGGNQIPLAIRNVTLKTRQKWYNNQQKIFWWWVLYEAWNTDRKKKTWGAGGIATIKIVTHTKPSFELAMPLGELSHSASRTCEIKGSGRCPAVTNGVSVWGKVSAVPSPRQMALPANVMSYPAARDDSSIPQLWHAVWGQIPASVLESWWIQQQPEVPTRTSQSEHQKDPKALAWLCDAVHLQR